MLSTTDLFVEHIISGILSLIWIVAIMLCFTGLDPTIIPMIKEFWGLLAVISTAIAYPIGIFVDTLADKILEGRNNRIKGKYISDPSFSILSLIHNLQDDNIRNYFTYNRFKTRVARSSIINFAMIGIAGGSFVLLRGPSIGIIQTSTLSLVLFVTFILLSITAFYLWQEIANTVYRAGSKLSQMNSDDTTPKQINKSVKREE